MDSLTEDSSAKERESAPTLAQVRPTRFLAALLAGLFIPWTLIALYLEYDESYLAGLAPNLFGAGAGVLSGFGLVLVIASIWTSGRATQILIALGATVSFLASAFLMWFCLGQMMMRWGWRVIEEGLLPDNNEHVVLASVIFFVALALSVMWYLIVLVRVGNLINAD